jgi:putative ABC transport system ATP-binding protein
LADEPTGNLDSANGEEVLRLLGDEVSQEGAALLMVTHDEDAAARADRVHRLADGQLVQPEPEPKPTRKTAATRKAAAPRKATSRRKA